MKKLYILLCITFLFQENKAQHTLTAAFNPAIGDIDSQITLDTAGLFLGSSGPSQTWNYTSISTGTNAPYSNTYVAMSSVPNNSLYPSGTIGLDIGVAGYHHVHSNTSSKIEYLGLASPTTSNCSVYGDPAIFYSLPFTYGSLSSDTYSRTTEAGTIITAGDGTGTLQLPSGTYSNILKLTISFYDTSGINTNQNRYYSALSKFPLLTISSSTVGVSIYKSGQINTLVATSLKESLYDKAFKVFPNPVTNGELFLRFDNQKQLTGIEVSNALGQVVVSVPANELNNSETKRIDVSMLQKGIYFLKVSTVQGTSTKKILIE